jgi:hypothetical protein
LASRGLSNADIQYEILYNHGSVAKFIMAIVSDGYLIADRDTWSVLEWSQNTNPYSDYADARSTMAA